MTGKIKTTYLNMLKSNLAFLSNTETRNYLIDNYILAELISVYCLYNESEYQERFIHDLAKMKFIVDRDYLVINGEKSSFNYVIEFK